MRLLVAGQLVARIFTFSEYLINFIARILPSSSCPLNAESKCLQSCVFREEDKVDIEEGCEFILNPAKLLSML